MYVILTNGVYSSLEKKKHAFLFSTFQCKISKHFQYKQIFHLPMMWMHILLEMFNCDWNPSFQLQIHTFCVGTCHVFLIIPKVRSKSKYTRNTSRVCVCYLFLNIPQTQSLFVMFMSRIQPLLRTYTSYYTHHYVNLHITTWIIEWSFMLFVGFNYD